MDERFLEVAESLTDKMRDDAIWESSKRALPNKLLTEAEYLSEDCSECGDDLPTYRKQRGRLKCVACQTLEERRFR